MGNADNSGAATKKRKRGSNVKSDDDDGDAQKAKSSPSKAARSTKKEKDAKNKGSKWDTKIAEKRPARKQTMRRSMMQYHDNNGNRPSDFFDCLMECSDYLNQVEFQRAYKKRDVIESMRMRISIMVQRVLAQSIYPSANMHGWMLVKAPTQLQQEQQPNNG